MIEIKLKSADPTKIKNKNSEKNNIKDEKTEIKKKKTAELTIVLEKIEEGLAEE